MRSIFQDVRFASRMLAKNPGFAVIAILTLGLGIGATTAVFSVVDGVLLRPIPYEDPHRTVWIYRVCKPLAIHQKNTSIATYWDWKDRNTVFDDIALMKGFGANIMTDGGAERVDAAAVTDEFFPVLGVEPLLGTVLAPNGSAPNPNSAVISYGIWSRCYGGRADVLGEDVVLDGNSHTVIGVMPPGFSLPRKTDVWTPLAVERAKDRRMSNYYSAIARLSSGVTLEQAQANMRAVSRAIARDYPSVSAAWTTDLITLQDEAVGSMRTPLLVLLGAVGLVLLIACANVANLLLARASARGREVAIRATLGARRWRVIRQFLCESLVLSLLGGGLGVMLAYWTTDFLLAMSPRNLPRLNDVCVDGRVLGFTLLLLPCVAVVFGLVPALRASRFELSGTLKEGGHSALTRDRGRIRAALVVSEIALSLVLLVGASLLIRSIRRLQAVDPGIEVERILTMRVAVSPVNYPESHHVREFFRSLSARVESLPGVSSVAFTSALPISERPPNMSVEIEGDPLVPDSGDYGVAEFQWVSSNYHSVVGQRLEEGQLFNKSDHMESPNVVIINRAMARKFWGNESPIGKSLVYWATRRARVVGVVSNVKRFGLNVAAPPECYLPVSWSSRDPTTSIVVRSAANPSLIADVVRNEIQELDRTAAVFRVQTMSTIVSESVARTRFTTLLLSLFAGTAALLAGVGIYGVISHYVGQRTREIGLRIAVGATARQILLLVLRQGSTLILMGVILGLAGAWALSRVMESLLFGVSATDPATFVAVAGLSATVAFVACYIPARRATKVDPIVALRYE